MCLLLLYFLKDCIAYRDFLQVNRNHEGTQLMLAISHLPSGISHYTKKAIVCLITMTLDIIILCTAHSLCTSSRRSFVVQGDPARPGENTKECFELMSAQTHRERSGGLCCLLWFRSTSTTRPSKHSQSFYSLTVLPPASTPPQGCCFLSLPQEWGWKWMRKHDCIARTQKKEASFMAHWLCFL